MNAEFCEEEIKEFQRLIGRNVARLRQERGMSQLELSLAIGNKSVSLVAGAEARYNNIRFNTEHLYKISKVLGVEVGEFFTKTPYSLASASVRAKIG